MLRLSRSSMVQYTIIATPWKLRIYGLYMVCSVFRSWFTCSHETFWPSPFRHCSTLSPMIWQDPAVCSSTSTPLPGDFKYLGILAPSSSFFPKLFDNSHSHFHSTSTNLNHFHNTHSYIHFTKLPSKQGTPANMRVSMILAALGSVALTGKVSLTIPALLILSHPQSNPVLFCSFFCHGLPLSIIL